MEERVVRFVSLKSIQINLSFLLTVTDEVNHLPVKTIKRNSSDLSSILSTTNECETTQGINPYLS